VLARVVDDGDGAPRLPVGRELEHVEQYETEDVWERPAPASPPAVDSRSSR
jgi:hypothetical protein